MGNNSIMKQLIPYIRNSTERKYLIRWKTTSEPCEINGQVASVFGLLIFFLLQSL